MKKNMKYMALGLAFMELFAACDKENVRRPDVPEGKILLEAGYVAPQSDAKYTFNTDITKCFFDAGDSVYINGIPYAVFPYGDGVVETDTASSRSRIWADISASSVYKGLYPKEAFTSSIADVDHPTVLVPTRMKAIPAGAYMPINTRIYSPSDGRVMPMTAITSSTGEYDSLFFRNTVALICMSLKYNFAFGAAMDPNSPISGHYYPVVIVDSVRITTNSGKVAGPGVVQNPYTTAPTLVLDNTGTNSITYTFTDEPNGLEPTPRNPQDIGFLPIVAGLNTTATMDVYFTARYERGLGAVHHYVYSKTSYNPLVTARNKILVINVPFSTANDFNNYVTMID